MLESVNTNVTVTAAAAAAAAADDDVEEATVAAEGSDENGDKEELKPLHQCPRVKGYILLLISAILNFESVWNLRVKEEYFMKTDINDVNWCIVFDNLSSFYDFVILRRFDSEAKIRYASAAACMTIIISGFVVLCYFDGCTRLRRTLWPKMFGSNKKVELCILIFLVLLWLVTIWFNTTITGIAGEGNGQYNIYFTSWLCLWSTFWTLERYFVSSGMSSFQKFVESWPNRCKMWIITLILSFADFLFVLDAVRNWEEGTKATPYVHQMFANISDSEWSFLLGTPIQAFIVSLMWILAEIFRRNKKEGSSPKSDAENYVEGILLHLMAIQWVVLIFFTTMPGRSASLIGNIYFTTWATCFSIIATLVWWLRDWRKDIADTINDQQAEYDRAKKAVMRREKKRLARMRREQAETEGGDSTLDENIDEEDIVDDDITVSIASVSGIRARTDTIESSEDQRSACLSSKSLFVSAREH